MGIDSLNLERGLKFCTLLPKDFSFIPTTTVVVANDAALASKAAFDAGNTATTVFPSSVDASVRLQEVSTLGVNGVLMNNDGDAIHARWDPPPDFDGGKPLYLQVRWACGSTDTADTVLWRVFYKLVSVNNDALSATVNTALNTVIPVDTVPVANAYTLAGTRGGKVNANSITGGASDTVIWKVEMQTKDTDMSEDLYFDSLVIAYHPKVATGGRGAVLVNPWP